MNTDFATEELAIAFAKRSARADGKTYAILDDTQLTGRDDGGFTVMREWTTDGWFDTQTARVHPDFTVERPAVCV